MSYIRKIDPRYSINISPRQLRSTTSYILCRKQQKKGYKRFVLETLGNDNKANSKKKRQEKSTAYGTHPDTIDIDIAQTQQVGKKNDTRDKTSITCYNYSKKGHFKRDYRSKKEWRPVLGKEAATIDQATVGKKGIRVQKVAAASYTQDNLEDNIDRADDLESILAGLETSSKGYVALARRLDTELIDLDQEELATVPRALPFEGLSSTVVETDNEGEVVHPYTIIGIVEDQGFRLVQ